MAPAIEAAIVPTWPLWLSGLKSPPLVRITISTNSKINRIVTAIHCDTGPKTRLSMGTSVRALVGLPFGGVIPLFGVG